MTIDSHVDKADVAELSTEALLRLIQTYEHSIQHQVARFEESQGDATSHQEAKRCRDGGCTIGAQANRFAAAGTAVTES
jgi:hypothetical protein